MIAVLAASVVGVVFVGASAVALAETADTTGARERPNIVFIYTDDQGPWAFGAAGCSQCKTPNVDRLARQGARLTCSFTTTPVCSPSRAGLVTSRYGTEVGITDWISPRAEPELGLDPSTTTWMEVLAQTGYRNGLVGKWHLGTEDRFHPTAMGYHYFMGFREGGTRVADPTLEVDGEPKPFEGFTVNILTDHALEFIRENKHRPFVLSLHYRAPHAPWLPLPEEDWAPFRDMDPKLPDPDFPGLLVDKMKRVMREYLGSVASVDRNVGRVLDLLDELKLADETVVIFTSDHGYNVAHHGLQYKGNAFWRVEEPPPGTEFVPRGRRPNMFDTSLLTPTAVRWPGVVEPGKVIRETISNLDWFPTLLDIAGAKAPEGVLLRGESILPLLKGEAVPDWDNDLYAEYSMHHGATTHMRAYRTPEWKLVRDFQDPDRDELYDLVHDPEETENLIDDPRPEVQEVVRRLHARILAEMKATGDPALQLVGDRPK